VEIRVLSCITNDDSNTPCLSGVVLIEMAFEMERVDASGVIPVDFRIHRIQV
jgi:hypothetical protein